MRRDPSPSGEGDGTPGSATKTYQLLGEREVFSNDHSFKPSGGKPSEPSTGGPKVKEGTVLYTSATLQTAVVDKAGQPPTK